jgi:hypothetical protein
MGRKRKKMKKVYIRGRPHKVKHVRYRRGRR